MDTQNFVENLEMEIIMNTIDKTKKSLKWMMKAAALALAGVLGIGTLLGGLQVNAQTTNSKIEAGTTFISLGEDLTADQRSTVLELLNLTEADLSNNKVVYISNEDEHKYLDGYLSSSVIGTAALSSAKVTAKEEGYGIQVTEKNINYCTVLMYQNALATAGLKDAEVVVAGPYQISGTAALIGAMKAYSEMTGTEISKENADAATNELVVTSQLGENSGDQEKAEALIAYIKEKVVSENIQSTEDIEKVVEEAADTIDIDLTESDKEQISGLMEKIGDLDLDVDQLTQQASDIYQKLQDMGIDLNSAEAKGFLQRLIDLISDIINWIHSSISENN